MQPCKPVQSFYSLEEFKRYVGDGERPPAVLKNFDIGPCQRLWTPEYLASQADGSRKVKVHRSLSPQLDFIEKNFTYQTISFKELVENCSAPFQGNKGVDKRSCSSDQTFWYLRSLGEDPRGKDVSDLSKHFPELYKDLRIPELFPPETFFSSVFRISSPRLQLWTHYDTCDNFLVQIKGKKRVVFFPPGDALNLYLEGDKSKVLNVDSPDLDLFPNLKLVTRYEAFLDEGDIIFIPSLWFHNVTALEFSISVNYFWKNLDLTFYDKKDTYGNKDVIPAQLAFRTFEKATAQLKQLPPTYEDFYLKRMIIALEKRISQLK